MANKTTEHRKVGRLAMRQEGTMWNAYYALPGTMEKAILLGSIKLAFVVNRPERRAAFLAVMREALSDQMEELFGARPTFPEGEQPAPEHERGGHG